MFEIGIKAYHWGKNPRIYNPTDDEIAKWIRSALRDGRFNVSEPVGASWGALKDELPIATSTHPVFEIISAERPD